MRAQGEDESRTEPWETAAALVRTAQGGDALAMDELLALVTPYSARCSRVPRTAMYR